MKLITDERCAGYSARGHPERPARITQTIQRLRSQEELSLNWLQPGLASDESILRAHAPEHVARLRIPHDFDGDTPYYEDIETYARASAGAALLALELARNGETVFSLMRPPGHHATRAEAMGFCFLNSIAIAVLQARATGTQRIAVFDFDVHHGNGTEAILCNEPSTAFFSVHQFPCYPGTGSEHVGNNCYNYPVPPCSSRDEYRSRLSQALQELRAYSPELIAVSAGFDAYARDPLAQGALEAEDYRWLGAELRALGVPMFSLLEGGYSNDLPDLILSYLLGISGK